MVCVGASLRGDILLRSQSVSSCKPWRLYPKSHAWDGYQILTSILTGVNCGLSTHTMLLPYRKGILTNPPGECYCFATVKSGLECILGQIHLGQCSHPARSCWIIPNRSIVGDPHGDLLPHACAHFRGCGSATCMPGVSHRCALCPQTCPQGTNYNKERTRRTCVGHGDLSETGVGQHLFDTIAAVAVLGWFVIVL